jgi:hypothetical protein
MVAPNTADLAIAGRKTLLAKANAADQRDKGCIFRLNIGFQAMQPSSAKA